jgi:hypothetical protein
MRISRLLGAAFACVVALISTSSYSSIIIYDFTGTVTDAGNIAGVSASIGDTIIGKFAYDTATSDSNADPTLGDYINFGITPPLMITLPSGSITFGDFTSVFVTVDTNINIAAGLPDPTAPGFYIDHDIIFSLNSTSTALATDAIPTNIDLNDFDSVIGTFSSFNFNLFLPTGDPIQYSIDTLTIRAVPIPSAVWLFGSGLLGLIGISKRKKAV